MDSGWQSSTSYTNSGLQANHQYGYQVKARDSASTPNETSYSTPTIYKYTLANTPGSASFSNLSQTGIRANWTANGNRTGTEYYCENTTKGTNSGWTTATYWDSTGLTCGTSYSFRVKARNGDGMETGWTNLGSQSTLSCGSCVASVPAGQWQGEYFNNISLSGSPVMVRDDGNGFLTFDWGSDSPGSACGIGVDNFSVRWTRTVNFNAGIYRFTVTSDDGLRLYVDGQMKLNKWFDQPSTTYTVDVSLSAGNHTIIMEYYERGSQATAKLSWQVN